MALIKQYHLKVAYRIKLVNIVPCDSKDSLEKKGRGNPEERKTPKKPSGPLKSTLGVLPKCEKREETVLIDPINLKPVSDFMDIPDEFNDFSSPSVPSLSPDGKRKKPSLLGPAKKFSTNLLPLFTINTKKL